MSKHIGKHARIEAKPKNTLATAVKQTNPTQRIIGALAISPILFLALPQAQASVIPDNKAVVKTAEVKEIPPTYTNQNKVIVGENTDKDEKSGNGILTNTGIVKAEEAPEPEPIVEETVPEEQPENNTSNNNTNNSEPDPTENSESDSETTTNRNKDDKSSVNEQEADNVKEYSPSNGSIRDQVIEEAKKYIGVPYKWGGTTPSGFDCSGYTSYVFRTVGINLPRTSSAQRGAGKIIPRSQAQPGDIVWMPGHIGIYAGDGKMYNAPNSGSKVRLDKIWSSSYTIVRVIN